MTSLNGTMVPIETVEVGAGGQAAIEFTNIPQTYTDLVVKVSGRSTTTTTGVDITFNGSSTSYTNKRLYGTGSTAASDSAGTAYISNTMIADSSYTANTFGNGEFYIPNYTSSNNKSVSVDGASENNATTALMMLTAGLWSNSAAITSIKITPNAGNFVQYSTATLYGVASAGYGAKATGGIITSDADYFYHTFLASGTFYPTENISNVDYLVVAGGGAGGGPGLSQSVRTGGGGAGGLRSTVTATGGGGSLESKIAVTSGTSYTVTVGAGGTSSSNSTGGNGSNSLISGTGLTTITSIGGGGGGAAGTGNNSGSTGGSGGGGGEPAGTSQSGGPGTANQGYAGGNGGGSPSGSAGGGGAGQAGQNGGGGTYGSDGSGGNGVQIIDLATPTSTGADGGYYAGGGCGGRGSGGAQGGLGGGGIPNNPYGTPGTANTGGGGSGRVNIGAGPSGGSGIVIIRYAK